MAKKEEKGGKTKKGGKVSALCTMISSMLHLLTVISSGRNCLPGGLPRD
jgi:hypothetical protein